MIDWTKPVRTKAGTPGEIQRERTLSGRQRVIFTRGYSQPVCFTYSEDGISRVDGQPSDMDLVNA